MRTTSGIGSLRFPRADLVVDIAVLHILLPKNGTSITAVVITGAVVVVEMIIVSHPSTLIVSVVVVAYIPSFGLPISVSVVGFGFFPFRPSPLESAAVIV